ncbi:MAG: hypothetical protein ACRD5E_04100 [Nitrososphaeraceae archaeon]
MSLDREYWLEFGEGRKRVLDFSGYEIAGNNDLPSQPSFRLFVKFKLHDKMTIIYQGRRFGDCDSIIIVDAQCNLTLHTSKQVITTIRLPTQEDRRMYTYGPYFFSTFIHPTDAEKLMSIIRGDTIYVEWKINGYASALVRGPTPIMRFEVSNSQDDTDKWPQIGYQEFVNNIANRLGLDNSYMAEFPLQIPSSLLSSTQIPNGVSGLLPDLSTLFTNMQNAVDNIRHARSNNDYRQVMDSVKTSVDTLRIYLKNPVHKRDLAKELFVDPGVVSNIDPTGGDKAAEDLIEKFVNILENLYQIASKPAHTMLRPNKGGPLRFRFNPDLSDAEFALQIGLSSAKYLISKCRTYS